MDNVLSIEEENLLIYLFCRIDEIKEFSKKFFLFKESRYIFRT